MALPVLAPRPRNRVVLPPVHPGGPLLPPPPGLRLHRLTGAAMGTGWTVLAHAAPDAADTLRALIAAEIARTIALFSPWVAESEISRLNTAPGGDLRLSPAFAAVLAPLLDLARDTEGASDPTLGALVDLWGFGPPGPRPAAAPLPGGAGIAAARAVSGWRRVHLAANRLHRPAGLRLDLSGSAKGWAVDQVSARLTAAGAEFHMVEIGGELRARGLKPDMQPWWVEIEQIHPGPRLLVALNGMALAGSGDWRRQFTHAGRRYAHTIDGAAGWPVDNGVATVSVLHDSAMMADALATALMVMGPGRGMDFAAAHGIAALMVLHRGDRIASPALARMMEDAC